MERGLHWGKFPMGEFSQGVIVSGEKFWRVIFTGGSFHKGEYSSGGEYFHRRQFSVGQSSRGQSFNCIIKHPIFFIIFENLCQHSAESS